jgi:hypothetical protein
MVDETKLNQFIGKILGDLGGVFSAPLGRVDEFDQAKAGGEADD